MVSSSVILMDDVNEQAAGSNKARFSKTRVKPGQATGPLGQEEMGQSGDFGIMTKNKDNNKYFEVLNENKKLLVRKPSTTWF